MFLKVHLSTLLLYVTLWEKIKDFFSTRKESAADQYIKRYYVIFASPPDAQRLFTIYFARYIIIITIMPGNFHFSIIKMLSGSIQISVLKMAEDIPLCIMIRQDHYYYE